MARSKPTRTITLTYAAYDQANNDGILYPCFIAPRYKLHTIENGNTLVGTFSSDQGVKIGDEYKTDVPYNSVTSKAKIDTSSVKVKLENALLCVTSDITASKIKDNTTNCLVFDEPVAGPDKSAKLNGYDVRIGDSINVGNTKATITDIRAALDEASTSAKDLTGATVTGLTISGDINSNQEIVYILTLTKSSSGTHITANVSVATGDLEYGDRNNVQFKLGSSEPIGSKGLKLTFSSNFTVNNNNNVIVLRAKPATAGSYTEVYVNKAITVSTTTKVSIYTKNITKDTIAILPENYYTAKPGNISLLTNLKASIGTYLYDVESADIHVEYRELLTEDANMLVRADSSNFTEFVGEVSLDNPLSFMAYCGFLAKTEAFYVIATADTTYEAYVDAINAALKYENVFALLTYDQDEDIKAYLKSKLKEYNSPEIAQFRKLWFADNTNMNSVVYDKTSDNVSILATMDSNGTVTFLNGDIIAAGVRAGDTLVIPNYYNVQAQTYTEELCKISTIVDKDEAQIEATSIAAFTTPTVVYITRDCNRREYAELVGAKAAAENSAYINYVWADSANCTGYGKVPLIYLCATLAAMRSANAPHAPLSEVAIPGWTVSNSYGLSEDELDIMNDRGVWIVHTDRYGEVVTRHQLTTVQDSTIAEEDSAVSNACNIIRSMRSMLYRYRGIANVTNDLTSQLKVDLVTALEDIRSRPYPYHIGDQIIDYKINEIGADPDNASRIMVDVDIDVPEPLLDGHFKFNII